MIKEAKITDLKFHVTVKQKHDFVSSVELEKIIVNRKKNTDGNKINWFEIRSLSYSKNEPFLVHVHSNGGIKHKINIKKKNFGDEALDVCELPRLYPDGRSISIKKYNDLIYLLKYVPQEKHEFFINLRTDESEDYGIASDYSEEE